MKRLLLFLSLLVCIVPVLAVKPPVARAATCSITANYTADRKIEVFVYTSDDLTQVPYMVRFQAAPYGTGSFSDVVQVAPTKVSEGKYKYVVDPSTLTYFGTSDSFPEENIFAYVRRDTEEDDVTCSSPDALYFGGPSEVVDPDAPESLPAICQTVSPDRLEECKADPKAYNDNPCLSEHYIDSQDPDKVKEYNTAECKAERGKRDCAAKTPVDGSVYLKAFGMDPETACVTFLGFTRTIVDYALLIAAIIAGFMFLRGGFKYTMSRGNPAGLMEARDQIMHATIGLVLLATAYIIILFLQGSFGYLGLNLVGPFGAVFSK